MPKRRKSSGEDEFVSADISSTGAEVYEKGGRVLRTRETCQCPVCGVFFSATEIQTHAQACLYFLEHEADVKKKKKMSSSASNVPITPTTPSSLSKSDSGVETKTTPPRPKVLTTKWKPNTVAQWNLPYAPVFRPSVTEFKRPLDYISKIRPIAEKYGICVIVPPYPAESWTQEIGDPKTFTFRTKVQNIHQLRTRWQGRNEVFVSNLASFLEKRGEALRTMPRVEGRDLDLFKLFTSVVNRGGYQVVERANMWKSVADELKFSIVCVRNNTLRNHYHKYLYAYESYRKSKLQFRPATTTPSTAGASNPKDEDDDLYIAEDITCDLYNTDYMEDDAYDDEFGFYEGDEYTLSQFEKKAKNFSEKWFPGQPTPEQVEEEFWRIVETAEDSVKVDYGSDLDVTKIQRSGFPRDRADGLYLTADGTHWNLNRLPRMRGSVLSHIKETVAGVTDPMLYVGMLFSSFCWHTEDNYLYSINYMHQGTAKTWYGVPASAAEHFEEVMKREVPDLFLKHPDLLHLLITMVSPAVLAENKVPIVRAVQEPGQYVITFPKAYHAGFSHGFTCAEAVNFAPADWLPYGYESVLQYRTIKRPSVFSHEELMCIIANRDPTPETAYWLCGELQKVREREQSARDLLRLAGLSVQILSPTEPRAEPKQCKVCCYDCFLSSIMCSCSPQHVACIAHHAELCETCNPQAKILQVIVPLTELDVLIEKTRKIQHEVKPVIDLTDDDDIRNSTLSLPNLSNMNNISTPPAPAPTPASPTQDAAQQTTSPAKVLRSPPPPAPVGVTSPTKPTQIPPATPAPAPAPASQPPATATKDPPTEPIARSPPATPETPLPKKGIVINLSSKPQTKPTSPATSSPSASPPPTTSSTTSSSTTSSTNPYENKIPPPPTILRPPSAPSLAVSSFTAQAAAKQPSSNPPFSSSSSHPLSSGKSSAYNYYSSQQYYEGEKGAERERENASPSPSLVEPMQGIALSPGYNKSKPVHIVLDSL